MADELDENGLPVVCVGDVVKLCDGGRGVVRAISEKDDHFGFDRYKVELMSGKILTEVRYRFDVVPSCPGRDPNGNIISRHIEPSTSTSCPVNDDNESMPRSNFHEPVVGHASQSVTVSETVTYNLLTPTATVNANVEMSDDSLEDFDIDGFVEAERNTNTRKKTDSDMKKVHNFLNRVLKEKRSIDQIRPAQLNKLLCIFFMNIRNLKGEEYEPSSVRNFACSIDRYLKSKNYGKQVSSSPEFSKVMEVIKSKQKKLKREGKGNQERRADAISDIDIEKLFESGQLGGDEPESLLRTIWLQNTVHFGMRGVTEHTDMRWGDVKLCRDSENNEFIEFRERQTKTRPGSNPKNVRAVPPRAWATPNNPSRCPVAMFKSYEARRPPTCCGPDDPYYIATNSNPQKSSKWFKCQPVGVNKLGKFMSTMAENAGLTSKVGDGKRLTNHSARKYLVQKLSDSGIAPNQIMQISGHKNIQSINTYSTINSNQQRAISRVLSATDSAENVPQVPAVMDTPRPIQSGVGPMLQTTRTLNSTQSAFPTLFGGPIYGGTFTINIHNNTEQPKRPRPRVISSDSE